MTAPGGTAVADVSVVVCTVGRVAGALTAVRSAVRDNPAAEVILVDQNESSELASLVERDAGLRGVRVVSTPPRGLAAARNVGVRACHGAVIAFTDDDCEIRPGWAAGMAAAFARDPRIGLVFGCVAPAEFDRKAGFVPSYRVRSFTVAEGVAEKARIEGIGACMAVRRGAWDAVGGFDEALGSGTPFRAGEDADFVVRALLAGWRVAETPDATVVHNGFRTWAQGQELIAGYMYGLGATNLKMLRLGGFRATRPLVTLAWRWLAGSPVVDLNQLPPRLPRLGAFLRGALVGMRMSLTPGSGHFVLTSQARGDDSRVARRSDTA